MRKKKLDLNVATRAEMLEHGLIEVFGTHDDGKEMFRFTDKFLEEYPEYFDKLKVSDDDIMQSLWFKGFIDVTVDKDSEIFFSFTEKSNNWAISKELNEQEKNMMHDIILYSRLLEEGE